MTETILSDTFLPHEPPARRRVLIGGAAVDVIAADALHDRLDALRKSGRSHYVCFCDSNLCVRSRREPDVRGILEQASLTLADGVSIMLGARLLGHKLPGRLPGPSVMLTYCRYGVKHGLRHFFYGGGEGVAERLAERLSAEIPGLVVAGTFCPPFRPLTKAQERVVGEMIAAARPDVLWVGLGAPKQERWMADHVGRLDVGLMLGVGAAFDFHSGNRPWAPRWVRKIGLEWLYRMLTGGRRVFFRNVRCVSLFVGIILRQALSQWLRLGRRP